MLRHLLAWSRSHKLGRRGVARSGLPPTPLAPYPEPASRPSYEIESLLIVCALVLIVPYRIRGGPVDSVETLAWLLFGLALRELAKSPWKSLRARRLSRRRPPDERL